MRISRFLRLAALAVLLGAGHNTLAQDRAGVVTEARGGVQALGSNGIIRALDEDDEVLTGDRIETGRRSSISLRFDDGTTFDLGERSTMTVDSYAEGGDQPSLAASVLGGVFRFVSGLIAKREPAAMTVKLTVATIGIRGTNVTGEVGPTSATVILLAPEVAETATAIEVANDFGAVVVDEPGFGTEIPDANSPPSPPRRMALRTIQNLMRSLQSVGRINVPRF